MKRFIRYLGVSLVLAALIMGAAGLAYWLRLERNTYYTDGDTIRATQDSAPVRDVLWQPPVDLGDVINSKVDDYEPRVTADGLLMYFVRGKAGDNADVYVSTRTVDGWSQPQPFIAINSEFDDLGPTPTTDGSAIYFYSNRPGGSGGYDLWVISRVDEAWSAPRNLGPRVNSPYNDYGPAVSPDGAILYFASNRPRGPDASDPNDHSWAATLREDLYTHDYDLYRSAIIDGDRIDAAQLLDELNTEFNEGSPAVSPSGDFVYFSSNREGGNGGFDLYRSRILRGELLEAKNLGEPVNTADDELDPTIDHGGFGLTFSSNRERPLAVHIRTNTEDARDYNLYFALSKEVFSETDLKAAAIPWDQLWPALLWLLLALLALLALIAFLRRLEYKRLSLLAKCLLASALVHLLIMLLLTAWAVSTSITNMVREGGIRVALVSSSSGGEVFSQVRENLTDAPLRVAQVAAEQQRTPADVALSRPMVASIAVLQRKDPAPSQQSLDLEASDSKPSERLAETRPIESPSIEIASDIDLTLPRSTAPQRMDEQGSRIPGAAADLPHIERDANAIERVTVAESDPVNLRPQPIALQTASTDGRSFTSITPLLDAPSPDQSPVPQATTPIDVVLRDSSAVISIPSDAALGSDANERTVAITESSAVRAEPVHAAHTLEATRAATVVLAQSSSDGAIDPLEISLANASPSMRETEVDDVASPRFDPSAMNVEMATPAKLAINLPTPASDSPRGSAEVAPPPVLTSVAVIEHAGAEELTRVPAAMDAEIVNGPQFDPSRRTEPLADARLVDAVDTMRDAIIDSRAADSAIEVPHLAFEDMALPEAAAQSSMPFLEEATPSMANRLATESTRRVGPSDATISSERAPSNESARIAENDSTVVDVRPDSRTKSDEFEQTLLARAGELASESPVANEPLALPEPEALLVEDLPSIERMLDTMRIPSERLAENNPFPQRAPEQRMDLLERMGGSEASESAVAMALKWLAEHQSDDGRWSAEHFDDDCKECGGTSVTDLDMALTGLSLLAFLGADHTHMHPGPYRETVQRAIDFLIDQQSRRGSLMGRESRETMYSHGIASIALCEAYAMTADPALIDHATSATQFILAAPNREFGGWRYEPGQIGDTSVTGWQVMALASAKRADIDVPDDAFDHVRRWMELVRHPDEPGRYAYQPGRQYTDAMTAEGMFIRQLLGVSRDDWDMRASAAYLVEHLPDWNRDPNSYYWYYGTLAMFHFQGPGWEKWNEALKDTLISNQRTSGRAAGSWDPNDQWSHIGSRVYQTAICALCLEVYYRYLPMYSQDGPIDVVGTITGRVTDSESKQPIEGAVVMLDVPDRAPITTRTDTEGRYVMNAPRMPEFFAISAAKSGYSPTTETAKASDLEGRVLQRDFELGKLSANILSLEELPEVHHLGNDQFEGRINSQFQRKAEGTVWRSTFEITRAHMPPNFTRAEVRILVKGAQSNNRLVVNGTLLSTRITDSPSSGDYGEIVAPFDIRLLEVGENTIEIRSVNETGDRDDFEFVNVRIRFSRP